MRIIAWETASQIALETAPKRQGGCSVLYMISVRGVPAVEHTFWQRLAASHEEQMSPLVISVLFSIWGDANPGLIKSSPENI